MPSRADGKDLLLVGSIPLATAEAAFRWAADGGLATAVPSLPDGEVGERQYWIVMLGYRVYHGHPDIETVKRPAPIDGVENWRPRNAADAWSFKVRDGVSAVRLGDPGWRLGYARDAIGSYFVFRTLREGGVIPDGVRFQVCLPMTYSGFGSMFRDVADWPLMAPAYEAAMRDEVATILAHVPHADLAIQWDLCIELGMIEGTGSQTGNTTWDALGADPLEMVGDAVAHLSPGIPAEVMLGYHLCYGTLGGWPMRHGTDLEMIVRTVHVMLRRAGRAVDYVHVPILDQASEAYFAPLADLEPGDARVYLGLVHNVVDSADLESKLALASRHLRDFGIAAPCGLGRENPGALAATAREHQTALARLRAARG